MEIASRQALAKALRSADPSERQKVLESLNRAFDEARECGREINQQALDELYLCYRENGPDRTWYAYLLLSLPNGHSLAVARQEFLRTSNNKILLLAATHLARLTEAERIAFFSPLVLNIGNAARCRSAANLLDDCFDRLEPAVALRAALISDHKFPVPPLTDETLDLWLHELQGPYPKSAEKALLTLGNEALEFLLAVWHRLPRAVRIWILRTAVARNLAPVATRVEEILCTERDTEQLLTALECLKLLKLDDGSLLAGLYDDGEPAIRAAAIEAGRTKLNWAERFSGEESEQVRLAILARMKSCAEVSDVSFLMDCLGDDSWRVRASAVDILVLLAPASLEPLRRALGAADEKIKVAAANALYKLGKKDWVRADLSC